MRINNVAIFMKWNFATLAGFMKKIIDKQLIIFYCFLKTNF